MGGCWHLRVRVGYKWGGSQRNSIHFLAVLGATTSTAKTYEILLFQVFQHFGKMQVPTRPMGAYGYSVRNYASAPLYPQQQGSQCASSTKPLSGKSFTIDALLAKPADTSATRTSPTQCGVKYQPAPPVLPVAGHVGLPIAPAPYIYSPSMVHSAALHAQPGYSVYCYPPFTYQSSCRGAFYTQGKPSFSKLFDQGPAAGPSDSLIEPDTSSSQLQCPRSTQICILSKPKVGSRNGCAPASPASSCPGWKRSLHVSSTWSDQRGSSWPRLCSSQKLR